MNSKYFAYASKSFDFALMAGVIAIVLIGGYIVTVSYTHLDVYKRQLEERLLNYPALAIGQCHRVMSSMARKLRKNVNRAMNHLNEYQQDKFDKVQRKENLIDKYESRLGEYLMKLTKHEMNSAQTCLLYTSLFYS